MPQCKNLRLLSTQVQLLWAQSVFIEEVQTYPSVAVHSNILNAGCCKANGPSVSLSQINHKYPERRLLVAESCGALAPYLPVSISRLQIPARESKVKIWCTMQAFLMILNITKCVYYAWTVSLSSALYHTWDSLSHVKR